MPTVPTRWALFDAYPNPLLRPKVASPPDRFFGVEASAFLYRHVSTNAGEPYHKKRRHGQKSCSTRPLAVLAESRRVEQSVGEGIIANTAIFPRRRSNHDVEQRTGSADSQPSRRGSWRLSVCRNSLRFPRSVDSCRGSIRRYITRPGYHSPRQPGCLVVRLSLGCRVCRNFVSFSLSHAASCCFPAKRTWDGRHRGVIGSRYVLVAS